MFKKNPRIFNNLIIKNYLYSSVLCEVKAARTMLTGWH